MNIDAAGMKIKFKTTIAEQLPVVCRSLQSLIYTFKNVALSFCTK